MCTGACHDITDPGPPPLPRPLSPLRHPPLPAVFSQVFLSLTLPVAVLPLCHFTGSTAYMGPWRNHPATTALAWTVAIIILALNVFLLVQVPASLAGD